MGSRGKTVGCSRLVSSILVRLPLNVLVVEVYGVKKLKMEEDHFGSNPDS